MTGIEVGGNCCEGLAEVIDPDLAKPTFHFCEQPVSGDHAGAVHPNIEVANKAQLGQLGRPILDFSKPPSKWNPLTDVP